jgi:hypothetical protein
MPNWFWFANLGIIAGSVFCFLWAANFYTQEEVAILVTYFLQLAGQ